jgi:hypothetical protein
MEKSKAKGRLSVSTAIRAGGFWTNHNRVLLANR